MTDFASYSERVGEVSFHPLSDADIADLSHVEVTNTKQIKNGATPYEYGPYDAAMGGQFNYDCATCEQSLDKCIGHFGSYHLATPVETILFTKFSLKWLRMICIRCSRLIFDVSIKELYLKFDIEAIRASPNPFVDALEYLSGFLKDLRERLAYCGWR